MLSRTAPLFGEIWQADLDPAVGHEQAGTRPVIVVSADLFNANASRLVIVVPVTRRDRGSPFNVLIDPHEQGLRHSSFALCEMVRSISRDRLHFRIGTVDQRTMDEVGDRLKVLLELR